MKTTRVRLQIVFSMLLLLLLTTGGAQAQLLFNLTPDVLTGGQNTTVTFGGTLQNTGTTTLFLNSNDFTFSYPNLDLDNTKFFANVPVSLAGGASWSGDIFDVRIGATAAANTYNGSFSIVGGDDETTYNPLASRNFQVIVRGSAVPAPGALTTSLIGAVPGLVLLLRRRKHNVK